MLALVTMLGVSAVLLPPREESELVELYTNPVPGQRAGQVIGVFADRSEQPPRYHVFSRSALLGSFELAGDQVVPMVSGLGLQALGPGERWVLAPRALGKLGLASSGTGLLTTYTPLPANTPGRVPVERRGSWDVQTSERAEALFFVAGGHTLDDPAALEVVAADGTTRVTASFDELPVVRPSRDGSTFAVRTAASVEVFQGSGQGVPVAGHGTDCWMSDEGKWLALATTGSLAVRRADGLRVVQLPVAEVVLTVRFDGDRALVVERSVARLWHLEPDPPAQEQELPAAAEHRFSSADLLGGHGGRPWVALGELEVLVPPLSLPGAPAARASARVRVFDPDGVEALSWASELGTWIASTPEVAFDPGPGPGDPHLVVRAPDVALVSVRSFP